MNIDTFQRYRNKARRDNVSDFYQHQMEIPDYQRYWQHIYAILPAYLPGSINGTAVYYDNGQIEYLAYTCQYIVEQLLEYLESTADVLRQRAQYLLGYTDSRRLPLIHSCGLTLMPVKTRKLRSKNDGVSGYIVMSKIIEAVPAAKARTIHNLVQPSPAADYPVNSTVIYLTNGLAIKVMDNIRTVESNISLCVEILRRSMLLEPEALAALDRGEFEQVFGSEEDYQRRIDEKKHK